MAAVEAWIIRAAHGLLSLFDETSNRVLRDTQELGRREGAGRVSTASSLAAFLDYLRFLQEDPESIQHPIADGIHQLVTEDRSYPGHIPDPQLNHVSTVVRRLAETVGAWSSSPHVLSNYSSPHYLQSVVTFGLHQYAAYTRRASPQHDPALIARVAVWAEGAFNHLTAEVGDDFIVRHGRDPRDDVSYLVMYHAVRARDAAHYYLGVTTGDPPEEQDTLWDRVGERIRSQVLAQLAYHDAKVGARFRVADLAFAAALLDRLEGANARQLVKRAIEIVASEQSPDGSFTSPPAVSRDEEILQITSYEIAYALVCLVLNEMGRGEQELGLVLLPSLARTFRLIQTMKETVRPTS